MTRPEATERIAHAEEERVSKERLHARRDEVKQGRGRRDEPPRVTPNAESEATRSQATPQRESAVTTLTKQPELRVAQGLKHDEQERGTQEHRYENGDEPPRARDNARGESEVARGGNGGGSVRVKPQSAQIAKLRRKGIGHDGIDNDRHDDAHELTKVIVAKRSLERPNCEIAREGEEHRVTEKEELRETLGNISAAHGPEIRHGVNRDDGKHRHGPKKIEPHVPLACACSHVASVMFLDRSNQITPDIIIDDDPGVNTHGLPGTWPGEPLHLILSLRKRGREAVVTREDVHELLARDRLLLLEVVTQSHASLTAMGLKRVL